MADDVVVTFSAGIEKLLAGIDKGTEAIKGFASGVQNTVSSVKEMGETLIAAFAIERVAEFVNHMSELGEQTERTAAILGITTTEVGNLNAIAALTGTSADAMSLAMERFQLNLQKAHSGTGPTADGLRALNIPLKELVGAPIPEQLGRIADAMAKFADGGNKTAIAMELFGRAGAQMIPLLDKGRQGFEEMSNVAQRTGTSLDQTTVGALANTHRGIVELGLSLQGLGANLVAQFAPAIDTFVAALTDLVQWLNQALTKSDLLRTGMTVLKAGADGVAIAFYGVVFAIEGLVQTFDLAFKEVKNLVTLNLGAAMDDVKSFNASMEAEMKRFTAAIRNIINGPAAEGETGAHKPQAPASGGTGGALAMKDLEADLKVMQQGLAQKKLIFDAEAAQFQITQNQKFALLQSAVQQEEAAETARLKQELHNGELSVEQRRVVETKIRELHARTATEMIRLDEESIAAQQRLWAQYTSVVGGAFNGQLRGLLAGTTSWAAALKNIFADISLKFIELLVTKPVEEWIAGELAKTTATTTGAAARAAAEEAGQSASLVLTFANALKAIAVDAAKTFGGIFGFLAPEMGPAAAAPAAAGSAAVMAVASSIPALDTGGYVLRSGLAMIHTGETVTRAADVAANGPGGGGHTFNFHGPFVTSTDNRSVRNFAKTISDELLRNPSLRPAY